MKQKCPDGVYVTIKPGVTLQWTGVLFVRKGSLENRCQSKLRRISSVTIAGPYAPAILRFQIHFPAEYPYLAPTIIFSTDVFHPLITPLTTYTYTTGSLSSDTVSASDEERLPPGSFSLRHGFPHWFRRAKKAQRSSVGAPPTEHDLDTDSISLGELSVTRAVKNTSEELTSSSASGISSPERRLNDQDSGRKKATVTHVLSYVKRSFDEEDFLDSVPLDVAGSIGAWKAWRAHRASTGVELNETSSATQSADGREEWNWDGVWEQRVRRGIDASVSDAVLFGNSSLDDSVGLQFHETCEQTNHSLKPRFLDLDEEILHDVKARLRF